MKKPLQEDATANTILAAIVSALTSDTLTEFLVWILVFAVFYTLIDYFVGKWE